MTDYNKTIDKFYELSRGEFKDAVLEFMKVAQLDRIAEALEDINDKLDKLTDCVGYVPPRYFQEEGHYVFRIAGSVTTD